MVSFLSPYSRFSPFLLHLASNSLSKPFVFLLISGYPQRYFGGVSASLGIEDRASTHILCFHAHVINIPKQRDHGIHWAVMAPGGEGDAEDGTGRKMDGGAGKWNPHHGQGGAGKCTEI